MRFGQRRKYRTWNWLEIKCQEPATISAGNKVLGPKLVPAGSGLPKLYSPHMGYPSHWPFQIFHERSWPRRNLSEGITIDMGKGYLGTISIQLNQKQAGQTTVRLGSIFNVSLAGPTHFCGTKVATVFIPPFVQ
jgi:hypothetical protein